MKEFSFTSYTVLYIACIIYTSTVLYIIYCINIQFQLYIWPDFREKIVGNYLFSTEFIASVKGTYDKVNFMFHIFIQVMEKQFHYPL